MAAAAVLLLLTLGREHALNYDCIWHVFIARQDQWRALWREVYDNAHPPLYFLLLKATIAAFGNTPLVYRAVSIAAVATAVMLLARVAFHITKNASLALASSAALGLSAAVVEVGLEVRSYALAQAAVLLAFSAYIDWLAAPAGRVSWRTRLVLSGALAAALLSHYASFFFLGAVLTTPLVLCLLHPRWRVRLRAEVMHHALAATLMFGVPLVLAGALYFVHVRHAVKGIGHVPAFLYDARTESPQAFLLRTSESLALLFNPGLRGRRGAARVILVGCAAATAWLASRRAVRGRLAAVPLVVLATMVLVNSIAALAGRYPYGGLLRHEVFLFPFVVLGLVVGVESVRRTLPERWSQEGPWATVVSLCVLGNCWVGLRAFPLMREPFGQAQMTQFRVFASLPPAVQVDQYNSIVFFGHHDDWRWRLEWQAPGQRIRQVWDVSRDNRRFKVCRSRDWLSDFSQKAFYEDVAECMARARADRVAVFRVQQEGFTPVWRMEETGALAQKLGRKEGVVASDLLVSGDDVFATFRQRRDLLVSGRIAVVQATYGANCGAPPGNATPAARARCEDQVGCAFRVSVGEIGDPRPGCRKGFDVAWRCGSSTNERHVTLAPEAGLGAVAVLTCDP